MKPVLPPQGVARSHDGYTLVEVVIIGAIVAIIATITIPALEQYIIRSRIEGFTRTTSSLLRRTRLEAIKRSRPAVLRLDTVTGDGVSFIDLNDNSQWDADELIIGYLKVTDDLTVQGPPAEAAIDGFQTAGNEGWVTFNSDGSVLQAGAFRIRDKRDNFLEIRVSPAATAKIQVRKWNDVLAANVDGSFWFSQDEGGAPWSWN